MTNPPSDQFIKRLITYYKTHSESSCLPIWTGVYNHLRELLDKEDVNGLRNKLDTLYIDDLWGLDYNQANSWQIPPYDDCFHQCLDTINSELKFYSESPEKTVEELERLVGIPFDIPEYPHRPVTKVGHRNIPLRFAVSYYIFHCLTREFPYMCSPDNVLEIGAGTGYFPYLFLQLYPKTKYNIIDLPVISVIQTYIYATMVGEDKIWFHGEPKTNAQLRIWSPDKIDDIDFTIDLALNHNSFPEIHGDAQSKYLQLMKRTFKSGGFFYSLNWEPHNSDQTPVSVVCERHGFTNVFRRNFPVESHVHNPQNIAFFEEIYKLYE